MEEQEDVVDETDFGTGLTIDSREHTKIWCPISAGGK